MGKDLKGRELGKGLYQRKDGRYEARAKINGNDVSIYGFNLRELKKNFQELKEQAQNAVEYRRKNLTLNEWFEEWFRTYKLPVVKETSVFPMKRKFYSSFGASLGERTVASITNIDIQGGINRMSQEGRATSSMREALGRMRECMESAKNNQIISLNPCFEINVPWENTQVRRRFLSREEQNTFLAAMEHNWYKEMFYIMFLTGMRIGDADGKISLNQQKPSKHAGLRRFGPEKFLQRNNEFMKERPIFYKKPIKTEKDFSTWLRCFYYTTKAVITEYIYF